MRSGDGGSHFQLAGVARPRREGQRAVLLIERKGGHVEVAQKGDRLIELGVHGAVVLHQRQHARRIDQVGFRQTVEGVNVLPVFHYVIVGERISCYVLWIHWRNDD